MFVEWKTVATLTPELILILTASLIFVGGAFQRSGVVWSIVAILGYTLAGAALEFGGSAETVQTGPVLIDALANTFRGLAIVTGAVITLAASGRKDDRLAAEIYGSIQLAAAGMMFASDANDLVLLFLGLELISVPTYVLLFLGRRDEGTSEAAMKYFFLSVLSSAILLYGFSFLYGIGGTTLISGTEAFPGIREAVLTAARDTSDPAAAYFLPFALVLITAGVGFKLAAVPFHFYAPDVYQGTTNVNAGLLSVAPKLAGVVGAVRLLIVALPNESRVWQLALVLSILTMTMGNICALWQTNVRRMMAYSSIAHAGYLLIGLATAAAAQTTASDGGGIAGMTIYLIVYALATLGAFAALAAISSDRKEVSTLNDIAGLGRGKPMLAAVIAICMFSLAGLPPFAGFWGKLSLLFGSLNLSLAGDDPAAKRLAGWFLTLSIVGVLNAAIAAAYYLRVIGTMYFQPATTDHNVSPSAGGPHFAALFCATAVLICGLFPGSLLRMSEQAEKQLPRLVRSTTIPGSPTDVAPAIVARD